MKKRRLGSTGIEVSVAGFGVLPMGPSQLALPLEEGAALLRYALDRGFNFIDTAQYYRTYPYIRKALEDGCTKLIIVLTRDRGYVKTPEKFRMIYKRSFAQYPEMIRLLDERHEIYNQALACVNDLEREGKAIVIAPSSPLNTGRFEKNPVKLEQVYQLGRKDAEQSSALISGLF